jgi:hypothetical protein
MARTADDHPEHDDEKGEREARQSDANALCAVAGVLGHPRDEAMAHIDNMQGNGLDG